MLQAEELRKAQQNVCVLPALKLKTSALYTQIIFMGFLFS
jgi:hypothetical protein